MFLNRALVGQVNPKPNPKPARVWLNLRQSSVRNSAQALTKDFQLLPKALRVWLLMTP